MLLMRLRPSEQLSGGAIRLKRRAPFQPSRRAS
ncbi:hypothetical protein GGR23_003804 [Gellertiella hungarica]|uniref:Uncharacterized protein n=1 Tax=Gellertiella hungarica TaxID=1572859 RepID=A0A7W6J9X2_9HYPH|nr:hypothetical protein [Gellertiella hungarica]